VGTPQAITCVLLLTKLKLRSDSCRSLWSGMSRTLYDLYSTCSLLSIAAQAAAAAAVARSSLLPGAAAAGEVEGAAPTPPSKLPLGLSPLRPLPSAAASAAAAEAKADARLPLLLPPPLLLLVNTYTLSQQGRATRVML
jgi:hypothetical protein